MTRQELVRRMTMVELNQWIAYYGMHPWGQVRADLRAELIANAVAGKDNNGYRWQSFLSDAPQPAPPRQSDEEIERLARARLMRLGDGVKWE